MSDQPTPQQAVANQSTDLADVAVSGLKALAPADRSWVAAFVVVVLIIVGAAAFVSARTSAAAAQSGERLATFLSDVEAHRAHELARIQESHKEEVRRYQETIMSLVDAVMRDSERAGRGAVGSAQ